MKRILTVTTLAAGLALSAYALGQGPRSPEERAASAVEVRQAVFVLLGSNMGPLGGMARGRVPVDTAVIEKNATRMAQLSEMIVDNFATDTRKFDLETEALDVIWEKPDDFAKKAAALTTAAKALAAAAASGDEGAARRAIGGVGRTCGGCHDDFRVED